MEHELLECIHQLQTVLLKHTCKRDDCECVHVHNYLTKLHRGLVKYKAVKQELQELIAEGYKTNLKRVQKIDWSRIDVAGDSV